MPTPASSSPYQRQIWPCLALVLLTLAIRLPLLGIPFERDEGEYAYIGWRLEHHEMPYRDWIDQKPPGIFWIYRWAFALPMDPVPAVHFAALLFAAASACAMFFLALRFMGRGWAFLAALLFVLLSADPLLYGTEANTEMFMLLPLILSVLAFFRTTSAAVGLARQIGLAAQTGIFIGIAVAFKQVAVVQWPLLVLMFPLFMEGKKSIVRAFLFAVASAIGIAVVWAAIVLYFARHHALDDFIYNVFTHNFAYVQGIQWQQRWTFLKGTLKVLKADEIPIWIFCGVALGWLWQQKRWIELCFFLLWLAASAAGVSASGYYFQHYFQQLIPVICLLAALGAEGIESSLSWKAFPKWLRLAGLAAVLVVPVLVAFYPFVFTYTPAESAQKIFGSHFAEKKALADRLAQITKPQDKVFIFGAEPEVLFYAQRVSATRYIFLFPLYGPYADAKGKQIAVANEIVSNAPVAVLFSPNGLFFMPGAEQYFTHWSQDYITQYFRIDSCLAFDQSNRTVVVTDITHQKASVINGLKVFAELDVRKDANTK